MNNRYLAEVLWALAADLDNVAARLWEAPEAHDPARLLACVRMGRDDLSRRVACANMAVGAAVLDLRTGPVEPAFGCGAGAVGTSMTDVGDIF